MADDGNSFADVYNLSWAPHMLLPNQYSAFNGQKLQLPGYVGTPTDARGNPIQAQPGTTLNTQPAQVPAPTPAPAQSGWNQNPVGSPLNPTGDWTQLAPRLPGASAQQQANYARNLGLGGFTDPSTHQAYVGGGGAAPNAAPNQPAMGTNPTSTDNALALLSNPGHVTTPGASPGAAPAPGTQMPSVMDSFLANNAPKSGAGGYSNAGFFNTLRGLRGAA